MGDQHQQREPPERTRDRLQLQRPAQKGTDFTYHCTYRTSDRKVLWYYGTVRQGAHKGVKGWVSWRYAHLA